MKTAQGLLPQKSFADLIAVHLPNGVTRVTPMKNGTWTTLDQP